MKKADQEKADVVSVILDDHDLLDVFVDALKIPTDEDFSLMTISENSLGRIQKLKCYLWKKLKDVLKILSNKVQVLSVLAEYHFKNEEKKIRMAFTNKDKEDFMVTYKIELNEDEKDKHPDISHIPNDQPIPEENPNGAPKNIPMNEPKAPSIPGPIETPISDPNQKPGIRVLNIEA